MITRLLVGILLGISVAPAQAQDVNKLRDSIQACWNLPAGENIKGKVVVRFHLNRDGSLAGEPEIIERSEGDAVEVIAQSAIRAVRVCAARKQFAFSAETYQDWREMIVTFDPGDLL